MILNVTYQNMYYFCQQHFDDLKKRGTSLRSWGNQIDFEGKYLPLNFKNFRKEILKFLSCLFEIDDFLNSF